MVVTDIQGTAITAADDNDRVRRNTSHFKKMLDPLSVSENKMSGGESAAPTETTAPPTPIADLQSLESAADTETTAPPTPIVNLQSPDRSWNDAAGSRLISPSGASTTPRETPPQERPQRSALVVSLGVYITTNSTRTVHNTFAKSIVPDSLLFV